jgi:hypothetical protein
MLRPPWFSALGIVLVLAAAVCVLVRLPGAIGSFADRVSYNASRSLYARETAAADQTGVDNQFVAHAIELVPADARFVVLLPQSQAVAAKSYGIGTIAYNALPGLMQSLLLPRREVAPDLARYILCYACDTAPYDARWHRLWEDGRGHVIGRLP